MTDTVSDKAPHYVDQHVGGQIRALRRRLNVSQEKLAETLGLTFQQVQKYEKGANRVSASKLFEVARALGVDISYFFTGLSEAVGSGVAEEGAEFTHETPMTAEGREIDKLLVRLPRKHRRLVLDMARAISGEAAPAEPDGDAETPKP